MQKMKRWIFIISFMVVWLISTVGFVKLLDVFLPLEVSIEWVIIFACICPFVIPIPITYLGFRWLFALPRKWHLMGVVRYCVALFLCVVSFLVLLIGIIYLGLGTPLEAGATCLPFLVAGLWLSVGYFIRAEDA